MQELLMKQNFADALHSRCGDKWATECVKIGFLPPGDTGWHGVACIQLLQPAW